jgi:hypothetical protein
MVVTVWGNKNWDRQVLFFKVENRKWNRQGARRRRIAGEVLVAIFMMGVGLLALLTLFPLGALEMAQAIKDDRTGAIAADASAFSQAGQELVSRTADFVQVSLSTGSVDRDTAARLRDEYQHLALQAADLERRLEELRWIFPREVIQRRVGPLLAQIRAIKLRLGAVVQLLSLVEN